MSTLKEYPIKRYRTRYGLQAMLETGTFRGVSTMAAHRAGYRPIATVDVEPFNTAEALPTERESGIYRFIGSSVDLLPRMLDVVAEHRALIFLDAHGDPTLFDGTVASNNHNPLPLPRELDVIFAHRDVSRDVIIIDDMHLNVHDRWRARYGTDWNFPEPTFRSAGALAVLFPNHDAKLHTPSDTALVLLPKDA